MSSKRCENLFLWIRSKAFLLIIGTILFQAERPIRAIVPQSDPNLVVFSVAITNEKDQYWTGLSQDKFSFFLDKKPQDIQYFSATDSPASVLVLLDTTLSMANSELYNTGFLKDAVSSYLKNSNPANEYAAMSFNTSTQIIQDWISGDHSQFLTGLEKVKSVKFHAGSALKKACSEGIAVLKLRPNKKRVLLVITDGEDELGGTDTNEIKYSLQAGNVQIQAIYLETSKSGSINALRGEEEIKRMASETGGKVFIATSNNQISKMLGQLAFDLRAQYLVGIRPPLSQSEKKSYPVKIEINKTAAIMADAKQMRLRYRSYFISKP